MRIINKKPRPRALFLGFSEEEDLDVFDNFFPTKKRINHLQEIRQAEWDVLITKADTPGPDLECHLYVLSFGAVVIDAVDCAHFPTINETRDTLGPPLGAAAAYGPHFRSLSTEFVIPDNLHPDISRLLDIDLIPKLKDMTAHNCLGIFVSYELPHGMQTNEFHNIYSIKEPAFQLFVGTPEPRALAGCFTRKGGSAQAWMFPFQNLNIKAWVEVALKQWHRLNPERFPVDLGWERAQDWMTPNEAAIAAELDAVRREREEILERLNARERELAAQLHVASTAADVDERRLLTAQDTPLVEAVTKALQELGFHVQDMDKERSPKDRLEDLRVRLPEGGDWVAICEVKGYFKGAKVGDLQKIERFRGRFLKETGRDPNRSWYIVNCHAKDAPSIRSNPLPMNADEVQLFAESDGLVVSTVELFKLWMDVRTGRIQAPVARELLVKSTGLFTSAPDNRQERKLG